MSEAKVMGVVLGNGPRVTDASIEKAIVSEHYFTALQGARMEGLDYVTDGPTGLPQPSPLRPELGLLTCCVLVLDNGFTVIGHSACASPENFSSIIGRKIAREKAVEQVWPLLGFRLRDKLHSA